LSGTARDDEQNVLVLHGSGVPESFRHTLPASPYELGPLRLRLREWLQQASVDADLVEATILSVSEAAANSIEHGLRFDLSGTVTVVAWIGDDGMVQAAVADEGSWRETLAESDRGHGLRIIEAVMDDVRVERLPAGTVVRMGLRSPGLPEESR
jgi:anti-sigma regulatory factor (Ser/Thr protein kinase)